MLRDDDTDEELRGDIETVDPPAGTFVLLGFTVEVTQETRWTLEPDLPASLDDLRPGMRVKVDGQLDGEWLVFFKVHATNPCTGEPGPTS